MRKTNKYNPLPIYVPLARRQSRLPMMNIPVILMMDHIFNGCWKDLCQSEKMVFVTVLCYLVFFHQLNRFVRHNILPTSNLWRLAWLIKHDALEKIEIGGDIWWNGDPLEKQVQKYAIPLFELQYPMYQALFFFDNARNHQEYSANALRSRQMNLCPGGDSAPCGMRDGWYYDQTGQINIPEIDFPKLRCNFRPINVTLTIGDTNEHTRY